MGSDVTSRGVERLRGGLHKLGDWSKMWQMPLHLSGCKVMHIDSANPQEQCFLLGKKRMPMTPIYMT